MASGPAPNWLTFNIVTRIKGKISFPFQASFLSGPVNPWKDRGETGPPPQSPFFPELTADGRTRF